MLYMSIPGFFCQLWRCGGNPPLREGGIALSGPKAHSDTPPPKNSLHIALETGVGQVIKHDTLTHAKEVAFPLGQMFLQSILAPVAQISGTVKGIEQMCRWIPAELR